MRNLKTVKKSRFKFIETWVFPEPVEQFIEEKMKQFGGKWLHAFSGKSKIGNITVDKEKSNKPDLVMDVMDMPDKFKRSRYNVIADPPWEIKYGDRRKFMYALRDSCKKGGVLIINCPWSPWVKGLEIIEVWKVAQAFNSYRDLVDIWVLKKI